MKKITLILMLGMIAIAGWAAEKPFLGWRCTDLAALKAAVTDADVGAYRAHVRIDYELMIAEIEAPDTVNTLAKMESFVSAARERYLAASPAYEKDLTWNPTKGIILQYFLCRRDTRFLKEIMADSEYTRFPYYEEHVFLCSGSGACGCCAEACIRTCSGEERNNYGGKLCAHCRGFLSALF